MKVVLVFFGGQSVEHDVSIITGVMTLNSIDKLKYEALPVYVTKSGDWVTGKELYDLDNYKKLDNKKLSKVSVIAGENRLYEIKGKRLYKLTEVAVAINCMHGERGEDGSLAGLLSMCNIPLASPDMLSSAVAMDKAFTKIVAKALKIKVLPSVTVNSASEVNELEDLQYPLLVKPNKLGSSIGVNKADTKEELERAVEYALRYGEAVIIEPCLEDFIEINCAVYRKKDDEIRVSECERPIGKGKVLSFDDKYESGTRIFPADIDKKISDKIKNITKKIYQTLGFIGVIRIDYFVLGGKVYLNEINSVPGSLSYYLFCDTLKEFSGMLNELIEVAESKHKKKSTEIKTYSTSILSFSGGKSAKRL
ncbi:MAG: D-alanine--D-alanine ligase [Clostridiales bacterium]|nr:D-alanine--D-alanine ligase [Clostridiales bacterium]